MIGVATPIGILAVNAAAFVMSNLSAFRVLIAACALVSSLLLNGLTALWVMRSVRTRFTAIYSEYQRWFFAAAVVAVLASSAFASYFTFVGMRDPHHLPDRVAIITAVLALGIPFLLTWVGRRMARRPAGATAPPRPPRASTGTRV